MDGLAVLQRLGRGTVIPELVEALTRTAQEVVDTGKAGTVTLTLKVSTKSIGDPFVIIEETIARSAPKKDPRAAFFFAVDGAFYADDPRQASLDFREVDRQPGEIREPGLAGASVRQVGE